MNIKVKELLEINKKQPVQKSKEWFDLRKNCITASNASCLLPKTEWVCKEYIKNFPNVLQKYPNFLNENEWANPYQSKNDYILQKCGKGKPFEGNIATEWGNKYEKVITNFYENITGKRVLEFGLMPHRELHWIKASPDGISEDGVMLEIKVPYRRKLDNIIPFYYWIQVQIQLEVCDLEECDYIECKVNEVSEEDYNKFEGHKGFFYHSSKNDITHFFSDTDYTKFSDKRITFFIINEHEIMNIKREREWFSRVSPVLEREWNEIIKHRETGCKFLQNTLYLDHDFEEPKTQDVKTKKIKCEILSDEEE